jgi:ubiquinone/menaquinone biosynthesis C-methylase UbiE
MRDYTQLAAFLDRYQRRRFDESSRRQFLTPGVPAVLDLVARHCSPERAAVLEVACGKGEAACRLAERHASRVVGIDVMALHCRMATEKARTRRVSDRVAVLLGEGTKLPVLSEAFDIAYCTGSPKIAGGDGCLSEMRRALKPRGWLAASDWVWRTRPVPEEVVPGYADPAFTLLEEYAAWIRGAGFEVVLAQTLPASVWTEYYAEALESIQDVLRLHPDDPEARSWAERAYSGEPRFWYETAAPDYWGYGVFLARKL